MIGSQKLTSGNYVRLLFWLTSWPRRIDNETPLNNMPCGVWC
ncbi:hypothetical protein HMPREF0970_02001 [Schaalia odontolytica F0309]|uniref:Uncharacterized protein n=1 Tax=Schaalia odontolytica F0309 TaxID=649742 RepID=D4U1A1_9ACTO|nr:hypothetical protein HMPREF0970_02001 [Schaalia odontolytica F0309]